MRNDPVSLLRSITGLTQKDLASKAATSQPAIALYESGAKSPTVATLRRFAESLGLELSVNFVLPLTREDRRSLAYHRAVVKDLRNDPGFAISKATKTLNKMRRENPSAKILLDHWRHWLGLPLEELITNILDLGSFAREMRQATPFAGLLSSSKRARILEDFRRESW